MSEKITVNELNVPDQILQLFNSQDKFCFLAGSGISLDPPSCLPTGYMLIKLILQQTIPQSEQNFFLSSMSPQQLDMRTQNDLQLNMDTEGDFLRFEQLLEKLRWIDPDFHILDCFEIIKEPNINHKFLAKMLINGNKVLTTNFDSLIEYALKELNIPDNNIKPIIYRQDWEIHEDHNSYYVYKLHGSVVDIRNQKNCRDSLQATLSQIFQNKSGALHLESWKKTVIESILKDYDLIIIGYSGLDDLDILPTLRKIISDKKIIWIKHEGSRPLTQATIEYNNDNTAHDSSAMTSVIDRTAKILNSFVQAHARHSDKIIKITVNTQEFLKYLWQKLAKKTPSVENNPVNNTIIDPFRNITITDVMKWYMCGQLYALRNKSAEIMQAYENALNYTNIGNNLFFKVACLNNIGTILFERGEIKNALVKYQQAKTFNEQINDYRLNSSILKNIGQLYRL